MFSVIIKRHNCAAQGDAKLTGNEVKVKRGQNESSNECLARWLDSEVHPETSTTVDHTVKSSDCFVSGARKMVNHGDILFGNVRSQALSCFCPSKLKIHCDCDDSLRL